MLDLDRVNAVLRKAAQEGGKMGAAAKRIVECADRYWDGSMECAISDALDGNLGADAYKLAEKVGSICSRPKTEAERSEEERHLANNAARAAAEAAAKSGLMAKLTEALAADRVEVSLARHDAGHSYYTRDVGANAVGEDGVIFARRGEPCDTCRWYETPPGKTSVPYAEFPH